MDRDCSEINAVLNLKRERDSESDQESDIKKRRFNDTFKGSNEGKIKIEVGSNLVEDGDNVNENCTVSEWEYLKNDNGLNSNQSEIESEADSENESDIRLPCDFLKNENLTSYESGDSCLESGAERTLGASTCIDSPVTGQSSLVDDASSLRHLLPSEETNRSKELDSVLRQRVSRPAPDQTEHEMLAKYRRWVMKTYSDQSKTKTVTENKYRRIVETLQGRIPQCTENSKFRFWIRSRGFRVVGAAPNGEDQLYVSTKQGYKKVAVVERFWEIIRGVHLVKGKNATSHAGQKKTYSAIRENYAFLPRLAVTKYLLGCLECYRRSYESSAVGGLNDADDDTEADADDGCDQTLTPVIKSQSVPTIKSNQAKTEIIIKNTDSCSSNEIESVSNPLDYDKKLSESTDTESDQIFQSYTNPKTQQPCITNMNTENNASTSSSIDQILTEPTPSTFESLPTAPIDLCLKKSHHSPSCDVDDAENTISSTHLKHDRPHSSVIHSALHFNLTKQTSEKLHVHFDSNYQTISHKNTKICSSQTLDRGIDESDIKQTPKNDEVTDNTITTTQNFHSFTRSKRKQPSYKISRHKVDSTIEISITPFKMMDSSSSGCESTISRSSDVSSFPETSSIEDSGSDCLDLSPRSRLTPGVLVTTPISRRRHHPIRQCQLQTTIKVRLRNTNYY